MQSRSGGKVRALLPALCFPRCLGEAHYRGLTEKKMSGGDDGEEFDVNIMDGEENGANASKKRKATSVPARSSKRQHKDQKFGFGGKKRGSKKNTSDSTADMSGFGRKAQYARMSFLECLFLI